MLEPEHIIPILVFSIPIIAVAGGIVSGIVRSAGRQRLVELAQRERIAAIERGLDPSKLPPPPSLEETFPGYGEGGQKQRAQALMIGGLVTTFGSMGLLAALMLIDPERDKPVWALGLVPAFVGVALLLSAWLVWPRNGTKPE